jgi:hypothetical protein
VALGVPVQEDRAREPGCGLNGSPEMMRYGSHHVNRFLTTSYQEFSYNIDCYEIYVLFF